MPMKNGFWFLKDRNRALLKKNIPVFTPNGVYMDFDFSLSTKLN